MKNFFKWVGNGLKTIWFMLPKPVLLIIILAFLGAGITKWITHDQYYINLVFAIILFGLLGCIIGFVFFRQLYWWIFKKGDYANKDKKE